MRSQTSPFFFALLLVGCPTEGDDDDTTSALIDDDDDDDDTSDDDDDTSDDDDDVAGDDDTSGDDDDSAPAVIPVGSWGAIACGGTSVCVLDEVGRPFCVHSPIVSPVAGLQPTPFSGLVEFTPECGLDSSGQLSCWRPDGTARATGINDQLFSLSHGAAIRQSDNEIVSWGSNPILTTGRVWEQLNHDGSNLGCGRTPTGIECMDVILGGGAILPGDYVDLAGDGRQVCGLGTNGEITCAEDEGAPTCVPGTGTWQPVPGNDWVDISGLSNFLCAKDINDDVSCFSSCAGEAAPVMTVPPMLDVCDSTGSWICGIERDSNEIRCWGGPPAHLQQFALP